MSMTETGNCWDTVVNGIVGEDEFENVLNFLDFPMEEIEETEIGLLADWDIGNSHCLGPIPHDVPIVPPKIPSVTQQIIDAPEQKKPLNYIEAPICQTLKPNKVVEIQEPVFLQTQSPVSVLESNVPSSNLPTNRRSAIPVRPRSKRARRPCVNPWLLTSSFFAPKQTKDRERRKKPMKESPEISEVQYSSSRTKKCTHCEVTKTPQWREGPLGPKTLCNACGVRYRSGRLFPEYRPAASPTFTPSLHSNSHKKVIEMRYKGKLPTNTIEEPPISPQPEFVPNPMGSSYLIDYIK